MPPFEVFRAGVPASSANLGPGFDAVGLALELRLRAEVEPAPAFAIEFAGGGEAPSHDGLERAIRRAMQRVDPILPKARVRVANAIPLGKGLGSSAAAGVLGLAIAMRVRDGRVDRRALATLACELEGHADNALPAVYGGAIVCAGDGARAFLRVRAPRDLRALIVVPDLELPTERSRAMLPDTYARRDVVFTAQRAAMLGAALATGEWAALGAAMEDRLHQPYRARAIPGMEEALAVRNAGVFGAALSGAGPSLIALLRPRAAFERVAAIFEAAFARAGIASRSLALVPAARGVSFARA